MTDRAPVTCPTCDGHGTLTPDPAGGPLIATVDGVKMTVRQYDAARAPLNRRWTELATAGMTHATALTGDAGRLVEEWVRAEQVMLWCDLEGALLNAVNGWWSVFAEHVTRRLFGAVRLIGPTPYPQVPWLILGGGIYEAVLVRVGARVVLPDDAGWEYLENLMAGGRNGLGRRSDLAPRWARTVSIIRSSPDLAP